MFLYLKIWHSATEKYRYRDVMALFKLRHYESPTYMTGLGYFLLMNRKKARPLVDVQHKVCICGVQFTMA